MLNCRQVTEQASALIDDELGWAQRLQMRLHLAMCRHCRRFVNQLRLLRDALGQNAPASGEPLPAAAVQEILKGLPFAAPEDRQD